MSPADCRLFKKFVQQGRRRVETGGVPSGAHGATNKEHQVCARRRVSEAAGSPLRISMSRERSWRTFSTACWAVRLTSRRTVLYDADKKRARGEGLLWSNDLRWR